MPRRHSAEERAGSFYRAGEPAEPPRILTARAKHIWRSIVKAKPLDWFDAGSLGLLADHCETQVLLEEVWARLRRYPVGSRECRLLLGDLRLLRANYVVSGRQLRLTVQATTERYSTKTAERGSAIADDIGGAAIRPFRRVA